MLPEIKEYSIPVYISDDSTNDKTKTILESLKRDYEYIYYYRNTPGLGHDRNCIRTLSIPSEDYVWYLGDSFAIKTGGLRKIMDIISTQSVDFIGVNALKRADINDRIFSDGNELLNDLGWHLTLTGATVYSKSVLSAINKLDLGKCKNFPQTVIIFERFAICKNELFWLNEHIIYCNSSKKSYWRKDIFNVFLKDWSDVILNLPSFYPDKNKQMAIKNHSDKTGIFDLYSFLSYRKEGYFNFRVFKRYFGLLRKNSDVNIYFLFVISLFPKSVLRFFRSINRTTNSF